MWHKGSEAAFKRHAMLETFMRQGFQKNFCDLNQRTPLQSRRGMEADLLPNPDSDCNPDASLQSSGESDPDSIKTSRKTAIYGQVFEQKEPETRFCRKLYEEFNHHLRGSCNFPFF
ncbi:hypothetical protein H6G00_21875 [Leptolyngbya sp. FACHB-541]|uniref:hypothetical protein n=1 Tax=Leptolyngbya sp. FACHB-541 TaxID=2692810 RepID=UPI0016835521|nr:hypothetical protein [Leptolyngbya sp. FACHB-541]MBD1999230.1 hypothetical protein [Leptolyngbya sp. FACHB-541]